MERRLAGLRFHFVHSMDGRLTGVHRSAQPGVSVEFSDHKEYMPGDDLRRLDWKAYARLDRFYVRQFTKDTHANVHILLDASHSMTYQSPAAAASKLLFSARLATALSYLFLRQNDAVGLLTMQGRDVRRFLPARSHPSQLVTVQEHLSETLAPEALSAAEAEGPTALTRGLEFLVSRRVSRSAVIVITDLQVDPDGLFPYLAYLHAGGNFCWLVHVIDPAEYDLGPSDRAFPFSGTRIFRSPETGQTVVVDSRLAREEYLGRFREFLRDTHEKAAELRLELSRCNTDIDPVDFIIRYLIDSRPEGE